MNAATISLTDDDGAPTSITLTVDDSSVGEGDGAATITVTATVDGTMRFAEDTAVTVSVAGSGTATAVDFAAVSSFNITIPAGAASKTGSFTLTPTDDAADETDETVTVSGTSGSLTVNSATITLTDNDAAPTAITLTVSHDSVSEGDGATTITVTATVDGTTRFAAATTVEVLVRPTSGTATAVDFTAVSLFEIVIAAGAASGASDFTLTPTNDVLDETDETVTVYGASPGLTVSSATITLTDDDATPTAITLTVDDSSVAEDDGATSITVTATVDGGTRFIALTTVTVSVAGSGTAGAVDFAAVSDFDIEINASDASGTGTFTLTPTNDAFDETDETITVSGTSGSLTVNSATIALTDDDDAPTAITLTVDDSSVAEDDGATSITVTATVDGASRFVDATTVTVSVAGSGTATAVDFAAVSDFDITIAAGAASKTGTFTLTPTDDVVDETNETITVSGSSGALTVNSATITLTDDDDAPTAITLTVNDNSVAEDDGATTITVTATVDGTTRFAAATTVTVSVAGSGTASAVDFGAVSDFDITIAAEAASANNTFTLTPTDDTVDETNETVTVSGSSGSLTVNSATITLTDDDAAPTAITLTVNDNSVAEDDGAATITVTATVDGTTRFAAATTVTVSVAGSGTATAVDFAAVTNFDITIAADAASGASDFTLTPTDDTADETDETITVSGTSGSLTVNSATISLTDDDAMPTLSISSPSVSEGDSGSTDLTFTVTLSAASGRQVTVAYADAGTGTATSGTDYTAITGGTLNFAVGTTSQTFAVSVTGDVLDESNETVLVSLSSPTNAVVSNTAGTGTGTITDDDAAPTSITLTVNPNSVGEGDGATTITVTATVDGTTRFATAKTVTVSVGGSGTAKAVDFEAVSSFDIEIAAGAQSEDETFTLTPTNDVVDETDETVTVRGTSSGLTVNSATITLTDDDAAPTAITLTVNDNSVGEGDGATTITVTATVDGTTRFAEATTVAVSVSDSGTATAVDFAAVNAFDIEIAAEAQSKTGTFTLTPTDDAVDETNETVTVSGSSGSLTVNSATITLTDDDAAPTAITLTVNDNSVAEDDGATTITVTATVDGTTRFAAATTVTVSVAGSGTATAVDFAAVSSFDITIAADAASGASDFTLTPTDDTADETDETITVSGASGSLTVNSATISLTDDDATPTLSISSPSVSEGDSGSTDLTFTVTLSAASGRQVTVAYADAGTGTATSGTDYTAITGGTLTFAVGTTSQTFAVSVTGDVLAESNETVEVTWSNAANATISTNTGVQVSSLRRTGTITDDDAAPTSITLTVDDNSVAEDDGATTITVTATVDGATRFAAATTVSVNVAGSGTATAVDFASVSNFNIEIAAGEQSKTGTFTLTPTDDTADETDETITVSGTSGSLTVNSATITLTDDDAAPTAITLTVDDNSVGEGDGATTITVTATVDGTTRFAEATTVTVSVSDSGTASAVDFAAVADFDITIAAGAESEDETFTLTPTNDVVDETDETVTVSGSSGSLTVNSATITLTDDDDAPTAITLTVDDDSVGEGDGATTITVTATVDGTTRFATATTVEVSVAGSGTATAVDFASVSNFNIEIAAGAQSETETFTLTPTDDVVDETDETVTVGGTSGSLTVNSATITLTDDDAAPTAITLTVNDNSVAEDDGATTITVTATVDGATRFAAATTVTVSVSDSSTATAVAFAAVTDFDITIAAGAESEDETFTLTPTNDAVDETDETITVSGISGSLTVNSATISLTDDDDAPTAITLTVDDNSVGEGDGATTITVTATVDGTTRFAEATTVTVSVGGSGTATAVDFGAVSDFDIEIAAGAQSEDETFTLTPTNDSVDETNETVTVSGTSGSLTVDSATITITDDDAAPTAITLTVDDNSVAEDDGATTITVTATVDGTTRFVDARTVTVSVGGSGTASAVDFGAVSDFDIEIAAEAESKSGTFTLTPTNDAVNETNETVTVSGTSGSLTVNSATITLTDDDAAPTSITLTVSDNSVGEGDGATSITVTATVDGTTRFAEATTVTVSVAGSGTATAVDFAAVSDFDIEIAAEGASKTGTFTLTPTDDTADETNETITVSGTSGSLTVNSATITLTDDDGAPSLSLDSPRAVEGHSGTTSMTFTVSLSPASGRQVTVNYADAGTGTATSGTDYTAVTGGALTFAPGATSATFSVTVRGDTDEEPDETVVIRLSGETNAELGTATGTGVIRDDDGPPTLSIDSPEIAEGDEGSSVLTFTVSLFPAASATVTVAYTVAGTASASDYTALAAGTLTFTAGETSKTITATVIGDREGEADETIVVRLSGAMNAQLGTAVGVGTITDDDGGPPGGDPPKGPSFEFEVSDQTWQAGRAIEPLRLPQLVRGGARLTYSLTPELPAGLTLDLAGRTITGTPTGAPSAREYRWTATDPGDRRTTHTFRITVLGEDPAFEFAVPDRTWREGSAIEPLRLPQLVGGSARVSYSLTPEPPAGLVLDLAGRTITGTPTTPQSAREYRWAATEPGGEAVTDTFRITVLEDHQPSFDAAVGPGQLFGEFRFPVGREITPEELPSAEGGDGPLTYAVTPALPPGLTFSPGSRTLSGAPAEARERTVHVLTATDEDGDTASLSFAITIIEDDAPAFEFVVSDRTWRAGSAIEPLRLPELVGGSALLSYSLKPELPAGLVLDLAGRTVAGTPTAPQSAREYRWTATNEDGDTASLTFAITIIDHDAPAFEFAVSDRVWRAGSAIEPLRLPEPVGGSELLSYSLTPELPAGLALDLARRTVTGTPTAPQSAREYRWTATEPGGEAATLTFRITVLEDRRPSFDAGRFREFRFRVGSEITPQELPSAEGGDGRLIYAVTPALPPGLTFSPGSLTLSGAPTEARERTVHVLTATDEDGDTASLSFAITVLEDHQPSFEAAVESGQLFGEFRFRAGSEITPQELPSAAGGDGRLTYAVTPALPPGLTFSPDSLTLSGEPAEARERTVHVLTATDEDGDTASLTFSITVLEDHQPSFEAVVGPGQLFGEFRFPVGREITPEELPSAAGGDGPLTYAVTPALPPGLTFSPGSRTLSGAPTEARERAIHVLTATDEDGDTASLSFAVTTLAIPMVMEIRIVSRPAAEETYRYGEQIELEAEFSAPVTVAGGAGLGLTVGERVRRASLYGVSGGVLRFRYTVGATDRDGDGVSVAANALALGGAESAEVDPSHAPLPDQRGHRVDGSPQAVGTLPALTLTLGGEPARVAVEDAFHAAFRYAARSSAPEVAAVSLEGSTVVVSAVADGVATVTVTGTNAGGAAEQRFEVTVVTARAEVEVVEHALAGLGRSLLTSASATVGRRLMGGGGGRRSEGGESEGGETETVTFSGLPTDDRLRLEEALRTSRNFTLSATQGGRRWTIWGAGDLQSFEGEAGPGSSYSGQPLNSWLGVDVSAGRLLAGVAVSRSTGEMEYAFRDPGTSVSGDGTLETRLMQAHPYLRWTAGQTRVWGQGGVGRGTAKLSRSVTGATEEGSLRLLVGLAGVRRELGTAGGTALALRADLGGARLQAEGGTGVLDDLSATVYRSRLGLELSRRVGMATPFFEFGGRYDGGSGATGAGLELAGGVRVADARSRIGVEAQGRVLALHSAAGYRESGVSLTARYTPSGGERGLGLEVQPVWGAPAHGAQALWADHELGALRPESGGGAMVARMRYGFGLLSPFTEVTWSEALSRMLRAGVRVGRFGEAMEIELAGSRQATEGGGPSYRFDLYGRIRIP